MTKALNVEIEEQTFGFSSPQQILVAGTCNKTAKDSRDGRQQENSPRHRRGDSDRRTGEVIES